MVKSNTISFAGETLYCGIDFHKKNWKVNIRTEHFELEHYSQDPDPGCLAVHLRYRYPGAKFKIAYEAGFSGFWACRKLKEEGFDCIVINAADIPTSDKEKKQKNDTVDARKIARQLAKNNLEGVYIPSPAEQNNRSLVRVREQMVENQTRCKNRIRHLLMFSGLNVADGIDRERYWTIAFIKALEKLDCKDNSLRTALDVLLGELKDIRKRVLDTTKSVRKLAETETFKEDVALLRTIAGIGLVNAMVILTEIGDIRRFKSFDQLCSYAGLIPSTDDSGDRKANRGITHRCNNRLRTALIESSWMLMSKDPAMLMKYSAYCKRMDKNKAIIRIGKHLLSRIRYVLITRKEYVESVVA